MIPFAIQQQKLHRLPRILIKGRPRGLRSHLAYAETSGFGLQIIRFDEFEGP